jgi:pimeloyl-ACP methyl ester carboxylesterase
MPKIKINGVNLNYSDTGTGKETILFSHGLLMSNEMFAKQIAYFSKNYRCIAYDHRGQAGSEIAPNGYDMDTLADDASSLIEALNIGPCHFVGLSMGGFVGLRLAIHKPSLLTSLTLLDTTADAEPNESAKQYKTMNFVARWFGLRIVTSKVMPILFGKTFMHDSARTEERNYWSKHLASHDRKGITRAVSGVIERAAVYDLLNKVLTPTLVVAGSEDTATPPAKGKRIADAIADARFEIIKNAGHSSSIEQPDAINTAIEANINR